MDKPNTGPSGPQVELYTDGACRGNPGVGGWGVVLRYNAHEKHLSGAEGLTTNNQMELRAAIEGLQALTKPCRVTLTTDSQYVKRGITEWLPQWRARGWKTADKKPVKNLPLWQRLDELARGHDVHWVWVLGHAGHPENELADSLANLAIDRWLREHPGGETS